MLLVRLILRAGQVLTPENELLVFGGHEIDYKDGAESASLGRCSGCSLGRSLARAAASWLL